MRPPEDGSCPYREVQFADMAAIEAALASPDALFSLALWAGCAIGPEKRFQILSGRLNIGKQFKKLKSTDCASAHWLVL